MFEELSGRNAIRLVLDFKELNLDLCIEVKDFKRTWVAVTAVWKW